MRKVLPRDAVVRLDEDLPQDGLPNGVVLGVEFVEAVESVAVLEWGHKREPPTPTTQSPLRGAFSTTLRDSSHHPPLQDGPEETPNCHRPGEDPQPPHHGGMALQKTISHHFTTVGRLHRSPRAIPPLCYGTGGDLPPTHRRGTALETKTSTNPTTMEQP